MCLWQYISSMEPTIQYDSTITTLPPIYTSYGNTKIMIVSNLKKRLKKHIHRTDILEYWKHHGKPIDNPNISIETFHHAASNIPCYLRLWITKWSSGICGVGKWMLIWKEQTHSKCPRCLANDETVDHVIHCQHPDAIDCWNTGIEDIQNWMGKHYSIPGLTEAVCQKLRYWRNGCITPLDISYSDNIQQLIRDQDTIGWDSLCFGLIHRS